jgi:hypothetical protein
VYDYYAKTAPHLKISPQDRAVWVSFLKGKGDVPVAAKLLRLRVFNDAVPESLKLVIPMAPRDRREFVFAFWRELGADILANLGASFENGLWSPPKERFWQFLLLRFVSARIGFCRVRQESRTTARTTATE